jgi:hypothetical protein
MEIIWKVGKSTRKSYGMAVIPEFVTKINKTLTSLRTCPMEKKIAPLRFIVEFIAKAI